MAYKEYLIKVSPAVLAALKETAAARQIGIPEIIEEGVRLRLALNNARKKNQRVIIDGDNVLIEPASNPNKT